MNLSFAGCGFLGIYHVGVAVCFKKYAPHLLLDKISGASAGALAACCLLCDLPLGNMTSDFFRVVNEARRHSLGPFSPSFNIQNCLMEGLQKHLPEDVHKRVNGRLHISLTRVYDGRNVIVSQYNNRDDVLQALLCACFIPGFSGILPPRFHGVRYMDGAFSDNLPVLDENTVTVSPFCGESDICPRDQSSQLFHVTWANTSIEISKQNINRFGKILFPPRPEILSNMCQQGFDDALAFLHRNNLINCTRCVAVQSTFIVSETISDPMDFDPECQECTKHRKDALIGNMPDTVLSVIQTYIDSANKGLANWLFRHRGFKLLHALSLPATVPADFMFATISKIVSVAPTVSNHLCELSKFLMNEINSIVKSRTQEETTLQANISCKIAYTECRGNNLQQQSQRFGSRQSVFSDVNINTSRLRDYFNHNHASDYDAFDHILEVTTHQDSVYAYYYMDDSNKVKVTEIFDMSDDVGYPISRFDERTGILQPSVQNENSWNVTIEDIYGDIPEDQYCNTIINAHDDLIIDEVESDWPHIEIEDISSDLSDPEVDQTHHISDNSSPYNSHRHSQNHPTTVIDKQMIQNV